MVYDVQFLSGSYELLVLTSSGLAMVATNSSGEYVFTTVTTGEPTIDFGISLLFFK